MSAAGVKQLLVHVCVTLTDSVAVVMKVHVRMIGQQRHGNGGIGDLLRDHESRESLPERGYRAHPRAISRPCLTATSRLALP